MSAVAVADVVDTDEDTEEDAAESKTLAGPSSAEALADADDASDSQSRWRCVPWKQIAQERRRHVDALDGPRAPTGPPSGPHRAGANGHVDA